MKTICILFVFSLLAKASLSQTFATSTINAGGNTAQISNYQFDWSIGEGASIADFGNDNFLITTGVLQSSYFKTINFDSFRLEWSADEVSIYPIPTRNNLTVALKTEVKGLATYQLSNLSGHVLETRTISYQNLGHSEQFNLSSLAPGVYYLEIAIRASSTTYQSRKGTFKIIKL